MQLLAQSALFLCLLSFSFGLSVPAKDFRNRLFVYYGLGCLSISLWALFFFMSYVWADPGIYGWHLAMNAWLAPAVLLFLQCWMETERRKTSRVLLLSSLVLCLIMSVAIILDLEKRDWIRKIIYFTPSLILIQILIYMTKDRKLRTRVGFKSRAPIYGGILILLGTCLMDHVPSMPIAVSVVGNLALMSFLFFLRQSLLGQGLLHFERLLGRFLVLAIVALFFAAIFSLIAIWAKTDFALFFLNSFIASFFFLTLIPPLRQAVAYVLSTLLNERVKRLRESARTLADEVSQLVDPAIAMEKLDSFFAKEFKGEVVDVWVHQKTLGLWMAMKKQRTVQDGELLFEILRPEPSQSPRDVYLGDLKTQRSRAVPGTSVSHLSRWIEVFDSLSINLAIPVRNDAQDWVAVLLLKIRAEPTGIGECKRAFQKFGDLLSRKPVLDRYREMERLAGLGEMAAGLAHEIRNPLGAIQGAVQILQDEGTPGQLDLFRVILEETRRLNHVVTSFIDYAKPAKDDHVGLSTSVEECFSRVIALSRLTLPANVKVETSFLGSESRVDFPRDELIQVFVNLLNNSVRAIEKSKRPDGQVRIVEERIDTRIRVRFRDNGIGISADHLKKVFIPFFTTDPSGTGLGLSICKKLIVARGGDLEVYSEPGEWTEIQLLFPVGQPVSSIGGSS